MVSQEAFFDSVVQGDTQAVISALAWVKPEGQRVDPTEGNNYAVREAAKHGHGKVVEALLAWEGHGDTRVDPTASANAAVIFAALNGHEDVVRMLMVWAARGRGAGVAGVDGS